MIITIPGNPIPQPRLRSFMRGGVTRLWDSAYKEKARIRHNLEEIRCNTPAYVMPLYPIVSFVWYMPIPASWSKKKRAAAALETMRHVSRPDVDNLEKLICDLMTGIFYDDDSAVLIEGSAKVYSPLPRTEISIREGTPFWSKPDPACSVVCPESADTDIFP